MTRILAYGSWPSPIGVGDVSEASPRFEGARFVGDELWWGQSVPEEGGRTTVRRRDAAGVVSDLLPAPWDARSRVHEYGGGVWTATEEGLLLFVSKADQRIWRTGPGGTPTPLTPAGGSARFGGLSWQSGRLLAVRETAEEGVRTPRRDVVAVPVDGSAADDPARITTLATGSDFLAQPALSPDGDRLAWVAWDHPDMPWDAARIMVRDLADPDAPPIRIAGGRGGDGDASAALQPVWTGDDDLVYADDPTGRWNLWSRDARATRPPRPLAPADADTGGALWVLGTRWLGVLADGRIVAVRTNGDDEVVLVDPASGVVTSLGLPLTAGVTVEDVRGTRVLLIGAGADTPSSVWLVDVDEPASATRIAGRAAPWGPAWTPRPRAVTFEGPHGPVHAFDHPPANPDATGPADERPPYVVLVHGGPTSHVAGAASARTAFFTSRGIGVLDVNYGGSTGYGRAYRERLRGQWGVVDVDDVAAAATGLAASGAADPRRIAIAGGSAGGWTVLAALTRTDAFAAGISRYGVGDARALAADTHDFEARYLDGLIGPLPEAEHVYVERSPLSRPERFRVPVLLLQGSDDAVVPPSQAEAIRDALVARGVPHAYVLYQGEGHGFRRGETVADALGRELAFLGAVFGFAPQGAPQLTLSATR